MANTIELRADRPAKSPAGVRRAQRRPNLDDVWMALALAVPAFLTLVSPLGTIDLAYHLRLGELIRATGAIPEREAFTFTEFGAPWVDQQWLAQIALHLVHRAGGFAGLIVMRAGLVTTVFGLVLATCRSRGCSSRTSSLLTVGAFVLAAPFLALRPQLLGAVCFAATLYLITTRENGRARLWVVPFLTVVWANVHGSFVFAPALVALVVVEDIVERSPRWRRSVGVLVATTATPLLTPWGAGVWGYAVSLVSNDTVRTTVSEWKPPSFATIWGAMFLLALVGLGISLARRSEAVPALDIVWVAGFTLLALGSGRNILWWAIAVPPVVAGAIGTRAQPARAGRGSSRVVNITVLAIFAAGLVVATPWMRPDAPRIESTPSQELMERAESAVPAGAHVFVFQPWASWVEFSRPDLFVFVDSRIEIFDATKWEDYLSVASGRDGWEATLDRYGVDAVMVSAEQTVVIEGLSQALGWESVSIDDSGALFTRA